MRSPPSVRSRRRMHRWRPAPGRRCPRTAPSEGRGVQVHPTAEVEDGVSIGAGTAIWSHVHIRSGAVIGRDCVVGEKTYIAGGVVVGDRVKINSMVYSC